MKEFGHYKFWMVSRKKWPHTHTCIVRAFNISEQSSQYKVKQFISLKFVLLVKPHILSCVILIKSIIRHYRFMPGDRQAKPSNSLPT